MGLVVQLRDVHISVHVAVMPAGLHRDAEKLGERKRGVCARQMDVVKRQDNVKRDTG